MANASTTHFLNALCEFHLSTTVGIPLEEMVAISDTAAPKNGFVVPSDAPGFGMEILSNGSEIGNTARSCEEMTWCFSPGDYEARWRCVCNG